MIKIRFSKKTIKIEPPTLLDIMLLLVITEVVCAIVIPTFRKALR